jgi:IclR family mhp operon transcriptional activator
LETLRLNALVDYSEEDGRYCLTIEVMRMSEGFRDDTWVSQVARPLMRGSIREMLWPCELGTHEGGFMIVRESTHRLSHLSQHPAGIGRRLPTLVTATGRAFLCACSETEREGILDMLRERSDWLGVLARDGAYVQRVLQETQSRGYAHNDGEWMLEDRFAAVAVPVLIADQAIGALNMGFPKGAVDTHALNSRYVPALKRLAHSIGKAAREWRQ